LSSFWLTLKQQWTIKISSPLFSIFSLVAILVTIVLWEWISQSKISIDWFLVFNATFSNISAISWRPVLVVEEARLPGENH
jgi:hypothetical protein